MKKILLIFLLLLVLSAGCDNQLIGPTGTKADFFPLETGNKWVYNYRESWSYGNELKYYKGSMTWKITDKNVNGSSIIYIFDAYFNGDYVFTYHFDENIYQDTLHDFQDTTKFEIQENLHNSMLIFDVGDENSFSGFGHFFGSLYIKYYFDLPYRYIQNPANDTLVIKNELGSGNYVKGVGLVKLNKSSPGHNHAEYHFDLQSFERNGKL